MITITIKEPNRSMYTTSSLGNTKLEKEIEAFKKGETNLALKHLAKEFEVEINHIHKFWTVDEQ